jgi:hypothetical protein
MTKEDLLQAAATIAAGLIGQYSGKLNAATEQEIVAAANRMARSLMNVVMQDQK